MSLRSYNNYLRAAKKTHGLSHLQAQSLYRKTKKSGITTAKELKKHPKIVAKKIAAAKREASKIKRHREAKKKNRIDKDKAIQAVLDGMNLDRGDNQTFIRGEPYTVTPKYDPKTHIVKVTIESDKGTKEVRMKIRQPELYEEEYFDYEFDFDGEEEYQ